MEAVVEKKAAAKKADTKVEKTPVVKAETKVEKVVEKEVKEVAKKTEPVKEVKKAEVEKTEKKTEAVKEVKKAPAKKASVAKKEVKASKEETKEETKKPAKKTVKKAAAKTTEKKAPVKRAKKVDVSKYESIDVDTCISMMQHMGVQYGYWDYVTILMNEEDLKKTAKNIIEGNHLDDLKADFKKDGYDTDLVMATLLKVADTMDITASEYKDIKKASEAFVKYQTTDELSDAKAYLDAFSVAEKILMIAQRKKIMNAVELGTLIKTDVVKFFEAFMKMAKEILKTWKYEDVEFYQEFIYAVLSQCTDLYEAYQNEVQMDCADLYIIHGDEGRGDADYNYVLRENQIKDYIYYRFASVYVERNLDKAKAIAHSAFAYVDDRYDYFSKIVEILEK